ncbi:MAG: hypothetical protein M3R25_06340 [Bacteroidota bacterium]|nr:hypothetical protein [Bacteroidota bacterium]
MNNILPKTAGWFLGILLSVFMTFDLNAQMSLVINLPDTMTGEIKIIDFSKEDTSRVVYYKKFTTKSIIVNIQESDSVLNLNPVYTYIVNANGNYYEGGFSGEPDSAVIILGRKTKHIYSSRSIFYNLMKLDSLYFGDTNRQYLIVEEIFNLHKNYPKSTYVDHIIYNNTSSNLISGAELNKNV